MGTEQKRAVLAVVISGVILFGWQYFFAPKTENLPMNKESITTQIEEKKESNIAVDKPIEVNSDISADSAPIEAQLVIVENAMINFSLSNNLTITDIVSKQASKNFSELFPTKNNNKILFDFDGKFKSLNFDLERVSNSEVKLTNNQHGISGRLILDEENRLVVNLKSSKKFKYRFDFVETKEEHEGGKYKQYMLSSDGLDTIHVGDDDKGDKELRWFGLDFSYHIFAIVFNKKPYVYEAKEDGRFVLKDLKTVDSLDYHYVFGKKEYNFLVAQGDNLEESVEFGIWSILAVPILRGLQFFFSIIGNYGVAIILLTIIIRTLTFPLQYKSFKSMKKMQEIQPELSKIREKHKENPQKMQTETMALFKKAGTNPLSGCLPMVLQMPIFFAFYRVLYSSVELVDAPFIFWIHDLSEKDPFYVLPVLMAVAMFFHQRLTPTTTMDPTQKKIMMFMPLIFAVFMKDFPSGLTLYIVVSTFVAMLQQIFVYRRT